MQVRSADDGPAALDLIRKWAPDVVVLDVMLPGMDGFEVLRRARTMTDAYIIMLTARAEEIDRIVGLSVGADDYQVKPFSPRELAARVRALLRRPRMGVASDADAWRVDYYVPIVNVPMTTDDAAYWARRSDVRGGT